MTQALTVVRESHVVEFDQEQLNLLKRTVAEGTTNDQFALFVEVARRSGLDPFAKQIYAVVRKSKDGPKMVIQTGIDGYRLIAQRSGEYAGQDGPYWCGPDGEWRDVWLEDRPPSAAKVGVRRTGHVDFTYFVATYKEYVQKTYEGQVTSMWKNMPANQLAKCAEAGALRKLFAAELSGIYTDAEAGASVHVIDAELEREEPAPALEPPKARQEPAPAEAPKRASRAKKAEQPAAAAEQKPVELEPWIVQLRDQLSSWDLKMASLGKLVGSEKVTPNALRDWASKLPDGKDPTDEALAWARKEYKVGPKKQEPPFGFDENGNPLPDGVIEGEVVNQDDEGDNWVPAEQLEEQVTVSQDELPFDE